MCFDCWEENGKPRIINPGVLEAARLVRELYEFHPTGGNAHIVVDDWNLEDVHILGCLQGGVTQAEQLCLKSLLALSKPERYSAMALVDGFLRLGDE